MKRRVRKIDVLAYQLYREYQFYREVKTVAKAK